MKVKELYEKIEEIKKNNPDLDIDDMEIGPLFNNGMLMMTTDIYVVEEGSWEKTDKKDSKAIAIEWMC